MATRPCRRRPAAHLVLPSFARFRRSSLSALCPVSRTDRLGVIQASSRWLTESQNPDGGWGAVRGSSSTTEATSIALLALRHADRNAQVASVTRAGEWLQSRQRPDGSWPVGDRVQEPSWATSLAAISLAGTEHGRRHLALATAWLMRQEGARSWLMRLLHRIAPAQQAVRMNPSLRGWPWMAGTASFVEPTAYAALALRKAAVSGLSDEVAARVAEAEALLYDRMCTGGGWNYGNSRVNEEDLSPFADTTALALIALQRDAANPLNRESLQLLPRLMATAGSGLALGWGSLCLELYGVDASEWRQQLAARYAMSQSLGNTKTVALALLALSGGAVVFRT